MRKALRPLLDVLRQEGATYRWSFPFCLTVTKDGVSTIFRDKDDPPISCKLSAYRRWTSRIGVDWATSYSSIHSRSGKNITEKGRGFATHLEHHLLRQGKREIGFCDLSNTVVIGGMVIVFVPCTLYRLCSQLLLTAVLIIFFAFDCSWELLFRNLVTLCHGTFPALLSWT